MKKLIFLLMTTSLVISPISTLISCGKKSDSYNDESEQKEPISAKYNLLLNEFKTDVENIINSEIKKAALNWTKIESDDSLYKFIKGDIIRDSIKDLKPSSDNYYYNLSDVLKNSSSKNYFLDVKTLINFNSIRDKIIDLKTKDNNKYSLIIGNLNEDEIVSLNEKHLQGNDVTKKAYLSYYEIDKLKNNNIKYFSSLYSEIEITIAYKSIDGSTLNYYNKDFDFNLQLTNNDSIYDFIAKMKNEIKYKYIKNGDSLILSNSNTNDKFITNVIDLDNLFFQKTNSLKSDIEKSFTYTQQNIISKFKNQDAKIYDSLGSDRDKVWDFNYDSTNEITYSWNEKQSGWSDPNIKSNSELFNYVMHNDDQENSNKASLESYISENWIDNWYSNYINSIKEFDEKINSDESLLKAINKTVSIKYLNIKGLELKINNDYKTDLENIVIIFGFTTNNKDFIESESETNNENYNSVISNVVSGIKSFHEIFGVKKPILENKLISYTGKNNYINKNIWDTYDMPKITNNDEHNWIYLWQQSQIANLNRYLSLEEITQFELKDVLLRLGNQSNFKISIKYSPISQIPVRLKLDFNNQEILGDKTNGFTLDGYYANDFVTKAIRYMDINFKINFMNITFRFDKVFFSDYRWNSLFQKID